MFVLKLNRVNSTNRHLDVALCNRFQAIKLFRFYMIMEIDCSQKQIVYEKVCCNWHLNINTHHHIILAPSISMNHFEIFPSSFGTNSVPGTDGTGGRGYFWLNQLDSVRVFIRCTFPGGHRSSGHHLLSQLNGWTRSAVTARQDVAAASSLDAISFADHIPRHRRC